MKPKMHIGIFTLRDMNIVGGGWLRLVGSAQYLQEMGHKLTLFAPNFPAALKGKADFVPIRGQLGNPEPFRRLLLLQASCSPLLALSRCLPFYRGLAQTLNEHNLDVIHCHGHSGGLLLLRILRKLHAPIALDIHTIYKLQLEKRQGLRNGLARVLTLRAERNLVLGMPALAVESKAEKEFFTQAYGVSQQKIHVAPSGADVEFLCLPVSEKEKTTLREEWALKDNERIILFAGSFKPRSGILDLIQAFQIIQSKYADVRLVLIGDQADMSDIDRTVFEKQNLSRIVLAGRQSRARFRAFQQIADVVVVPEADNPFARLFPPLKLYDVMASGRPAVVTRIASRAEMIEDGVTGYLVEPENAVDMARGIEQALNYPNALDMGGRAREFVKDNHSCRQSAKRMIEVYKTIVRHHKTTDSGASAHN